MAASTLTRTVSLAALAAAVWTAGWGLAVATDQPTPTIEVVAIESGSRFLPLGIGKSVVVDLPHDVKDVLVADPRIANAVIRSARRAYLIGVTVGQTNVYFFDAAGRQIAGFDIAVTRNLNGLRAALKQALPDADIRVEGIGDGVVLTGTVASAAESQQAYDIASALLGPSFGGVNTRIANSIIIRARDQVMLKVMVAEVQREVIKQLGIDLNGNLGYGVTTLNFNTSNPFALSGAALSTTSAARASTGNSVAPRLSATLRAMERAGLIRTLAEPNLTAISGETATFIAGGEFPVPGGLSCDPATRICQVTVQFKKFGVGLNFTPVVLAEGRISLKINTEVSELSNENALTLEQSFGSGQSQTLTIPSVKVRRAETMLEIPSGGALAMAGMIQEQTKQQINGVPGLMELPILGTLFKSREYINRQTELVVIVTPYIVRAVAQKDLSKPDDGYADSADPAGMLLGQFNRIYGVAGRGPRKTYHGSYGFILD